MKPIEEGSRTVLSMENQHLRPLLYIYSLLYLFYIFIRKNTFKKIYWQKLRRNLAQSVGLSNHLHTLIYKKRNELATMSIQTLAEYNTSPT